MIPERLAGGGRHCALRQTFILLCLILAGACQAPEQDSRPLVAASIAPLQFFVDQLAGQSLRTIALVPAGSDAHVFEPRPEQLRLLSEAHLLVESGMEFEAAWRPRFLAANPSLQIISPASRFADLRYIHIHRSGSSNPVAQRHDSPDPHYWQSPARAAALLDYLRDELCQRFPERCSNFRAHAESFRPQIAALDAECRRRTQALAVRSFVSYHPSWNYFAKDYHLEMIALEHGGQEPGPAQTAAAVEHARSRGVRVVLIEPELSDRSAAMFAREIDAPLRRVAPLAYDWPAAIRSFLDALEGR
ncbi:MAG: zinc ABC transporter substrate-binding protein [Leptospirales bacterium]|nr:zinc ABC transporter substrate-binding protein [Leptospirales bacterium]